MNQFSQRPPQKRNVPPTQRPPYPKTSPGNVPPASRPLARRRSYRRRPASSLIGTLLCALLFFAVILVSLFVISSTRNTSLPDADSVPYETFSPEDTTANDIHTQAPDSAAAGPPAPLYTPESVSVTVSNTSVHEGNLILVNADYPFVFPDSQPQTVLYGNKSPVYMLSTADISLNSSLFPIFDGMLLDFSNATGCREVLVTSGFRTYAFQEDLFNSRVASQGEEYASLYVARPGHSEHHAGLAIDMVIFANGQQYYFPDYEEAQWLIEHAPEYGFILRYTEEKQNITQCAAEPWHYRYVGTPHAQLVTALGLCFEEYHSYLRDFRWDGDRLYISADGTTTEIIDGFTLPSDGYMVYYVPADSSSDTTEIPLPPDLPYEISGDNINGFLVTVTLG